MALVTTTKYMVRIKQYTYRLLTVYDTIDDASAAVAAQDNPADWFIQPEIVYIPA